MKHVLITNQHGENRGDESALRAMLDGINKNLDEVKFTVIAQLQDTGIKIDFDEDVTLLHMKMSMSRFLGLVLYSMLARLGLRLSSLLDDNTRNIIDAYDDCDVVVSAPGGPYFGDIYAGHEIVHWYYIWLGLVRKKPLFLYAPSAGPFEIRWLNIIRRYFYRKFDTICVREEISKSYLNGLLGEEVEVIVTADSAIQQLVEPLSRDEYFTDERAPARDKYLVAVSAIEYKFPGSADPAEKQAEYNKALLECLAHIAEHKDCHFLFIPQLYGKVHTDVPYLQYLTQNLPAGASYEIVSQKYDSTMQRRIFAMSDLCIASRYHPQIFAGTSCVPGICIYYEHKAIGFMQLLGMEEFAFDIRNLDKTEMFGKLDLVMDNGDQLRERMRHRVPGIVQRSAKTTELLVELIKGR